MSAPPIIATPTNIRRREPRPPSDYSIVLQTVQAAGLFERRYLYYAVKIGLTFAALGGVCVAFAYIGNSWLQMAIAAVLAVIITQIVFLSHEAAHRQIFRSNAANEMAALIMGTLFCGVSLAWWHNKHNKHHAAPNQLGKDPDISPSLVHFYPPEKRPRSFLGILMHERQGWWFFPLLVVEALNLHAQSVQALATKPKLKRRRTEIVMMIIRLGGYPAILFIFLSPGIAGAFLGVQLAVTGVYLGAAFSASHIAKPILPHDLRIDFFSRQVLTSRNIIGGRPMSWAMGGLDLQIEHHLFPNVAGPNLRKVRPMVMEFCRVNDIIYQEMTILRAWFIVSRYLNRVGLSHATLECPIVAGLRPH